jgi:cytochrome P450
MMTTTDLPTLSGPRALAALADLALPSIGAGAILRRKLVVAMLDRTGADARAVRRLRELRERFGGTPVLLNLGVRKILILTHPEDVGYVLKRSPTPFHPANTEKRKALKQFQPHGVLISSRERRTERRSVNERALDTQAPLHRLATDFARIVDDEAADLAAAVQKANVLTSAMFETAWWRLVRRLVLGERARTDDRITDDLRRLRSAANWSFAGLPHRRLARRFHTGLQHYAAQPDPASLLGALADVPADPGVDPVGQVPQWLFAFDAANMATLRALALLATHPEQHGHAMADAADPARPALRPYLRGCVLESVRLWPTTPALLRDIAADDAEPLHWGTATGLIDVPRGTGVLITVPAFHRDRGTLPFADSFDPSLWVDGRAQQYPQLVPFSAGPVECPGRNLVLFVTSTMLAQLLSRLELTLADPYRLDPSKPLPATLNQYALRFPARACQTTTPR